jgi:transcriptional regulator with XRE-family HTH domain
MFEIGRSLREARRREGLELDDVVRATQIRARYLEALEQERFDLLPDGFYRRSFLRRYAEFLGLNGDTFLDEYDQRLADAHVEYEAEPGRRPISLAELAVSARRPLALAALVAVVGIGVWVLAGSTRTGGAPAPTHPHAARAVGAKLGPPRPPHRKAPAPKPPTALTLIAVRGSCWLQVRVGSSNGTTILTQTLQPGQHVRLGLRRVLWIRLGAPWNLDARIGHRRVSAMLPQTSGDVLAAATGMRSTT